MGRGGVGVVVSVRVRVRVWVRSAVFLLKNWSTTPNNHDTIFPDLHILS